MAEGAGAVGGTARLLGFAGLLPQVAAMALVFVGGPLGAIGTVMAFAYGALILSFLGGIWWAIAMRRTERSQARLAGVAVLPSLVPLPLGFLMFAAEQPGLSLILLGSAILMMMTVDARLAASSEVPSNWLRLRRPLSIGLGGMTIVIGILAPTFGVV